MRVVEKSCEEPGRGEVKRIELRWEEMKKLERLKRVVRRSEKSCDGLRRAVKSRKVVATVDKTETRRGRTHITELRGCEAFF